jgi:hypothetical protein
MKLAALLLLCSTFAMSQELPQAPKPHLDRIEMALLASDAAVRAVDVYSTHRMLQQGNRELFLPGFIANHTPVMALYSGAMVYADYKAASMLQAHHHTRMAKMVLLADQLQVAPWDLHNFALPNHKPQQLGRKP